MWIDSIFSHLILKSLILVYLIFLIRSEAEVVKTKLSNGSPVDGYVITRVQRRVHAYRGIPYARPPINERRFQRPRTDLKWSEPLEATKPGAACPGGASTLPGQRVSEDCLYLDIFFDEPCRELICPINVFISEPNSFYREDEYTIIHNKSDPELMIFFNYRFGPFGFLDLDSSNANLGLYDFIEALKWIKRETPNFYGDPQNLTLTAFGEVSSTLVQYLLSSPAVNSEELPLKRVMLIDSHPLLRPQRSKEQTRKLLERLGCSRDQRSRPLSSRQQMACLRSKSTDEIWRSAPNHLDFLPQPDSRLLPSESYAELLHEKLRVRALFGAGTEQMFHIGKSNSNVIEKFDPIKNQAKKMPFLFLERIIYRAQPSTAYLISHRSEPFASDRGESVEELCESYTRSLFAYKSSAVRRACAERYSGAGDEIGRYAVHAMNSHFGALNSRLGGRTYSAIFAQPNTFAPNFEYQFLNSRIGDNDTASQHKLHMLYMQSRERFVHQGLIPIEGFIPVNEKGENYFFLEYELASDNVSTMKEPEMRTGERFNEEATRFWLEELSDLERRSNGASPLLGCCRIICAFGLMLHLLFFALTNRFH